MAKVYAPKVEGILDELVTVISARATADSVTVGETVKGLKAKDRTYQNGGIYVFLPRDDDGRLLPNKQRQTDLYVAVACIARASTDATGLTRILELVGVVLDAIGEKETLNGKAIIAYPVSVDPDSEDIGDDVMLYGATVLVKCVVQYSMT